MIFIRGTCSWWMVVAGFAIRYIWFPRPRREHSCCDATLNETCRMITGCLNPTNTNSLSVLAGIAPSDIRRAVASRTDTASYGRKAPTQWTYRRCVTPEIAEELCHALSQSTRQRKLFAWSYGENDSSPWTPVCTLTSVLTNTSQLAQRIPGQPGRHSTGWVHRLADQEWTCWSGDFPTNKKPVTVASGRPCNTYWSAPWWTLPALPHDLTMANGIAIGCARHWEGTIWWTYDSWWKD